MKCRSGNSFDEHGKNGFVHVQAIFRLIVNNGLAAVGDFFGNFFAAVDGHAMHEDRIGFGVRHDVFRDLITG